MNTQRSRSTEWVNCC